MNSSAHRMTRRWRACPVVELLEPRLVLSADGLPAISGDASVPEGALYTLNLDAAGKALDSWRIDWGDGTIENLPGSAVAASHRFADGLPTTRDIVATAFETSPLSLISWSSAGGNGHFYALTPAAQTWVEAEALAVSLGGHLVSITSQAEQDFVAQTFLAGVNARNIHWIGVNDQLVEGQYVWSSGEAIGFTRWQSGEPNNFRGVEDYGTINWHFGHGIGGGTFASWNDTPLDGYNSNASGPQLSRGLMEFTTRPGGPVTVRSLSLTVENAPLAVAIAGTTSAFAGDTFSFTLTASDPSAVDAAAGFTYAIDWDGDGTNDQHTEGPSVQDVAHVFDVPGQWTILVRAIDKDGGESQAAALQVEVLNQLPEADLSGPAAGVRGQELTFILGASDATPGDEAAGFAFDLDWDGDGVTDQTVVGPAGTTVTHRFSAVGSQHVALTVTDQYGGVSAVVGLDVSITAVAVVDGVLVVGGTAANDQIFVLDDWAGGVFVWMNGASLGRFAAPGRVRVFGYGGDDIISALALSREVELFGGDGADLLVAGQSGGVLKGEAGNDILLGGRGMDVLDGGDGDDLIIGHVRQDVVVSSAGRDRYFGLAWGRGGHPLYAEADWDCLPHNNKGKGRR